MGLERLKIGVEHDVYFFTQIGGVVPNATNATNATMNNTDFSEFDKKMTEYSLYYVYIGAAVFVSSFFQVNILPGKSREHLCAKAFPDMHLS